MVKNILSNNSANKEEILTSILLIAYRIRNNLFHGLKDFSLIDEQDEMFKVINLFLLDMVASYRNRNMR